MEFDSMAHAMGLTLQIVFLDIILSGDNALVIALACRSLPPAMMKKAILIGTGVAILLRILLTVITSFVLQVPFLKILGGLMLMIIAIKLMLGDNEDEQAQDNNQTQQHLWTAVGMVVMADLILSTDNVIALAAVAQGNIAYMILGFIVSVPLLMYGSMRLTRLLDNYPLLIPGGGALLGWVAGRIAMSDSLISDWVSSQSPALTVIVPLLCVVFVLSENRIIREQRQLKRTPPAPLFTHWLGKLSHLGDATLPSQPQPVTATAAEPGQAAHVSQPVVPTPIAIAATAARSPLPATPASSGQPASVASIPAPAVVIDDIDLQNVLVKIVMVVAGLVAVIVLGWLVTHLLTQGFLPTPKHPLHHR